MNPSPAPAPEVTARLKAEYPDARTELDWTNPLELLVATMLSAQTTDVQVNRVTENLFAKYRTAEDYADSDPDELEEDIRPTGFYRNKARSLRGMASALVEEHGGEVPRTMSELVALPGVGRKTANVVLGNAFGTNEGVVVDTHVRRVSNRLGLTESQDPGEDRAGSHGASARRRQDHLLPPPDPARSPNVQVPQARLPELRLSNDICPSADL